MRRLLFGLATLAFACASEPPDPSSEQRRLRAQASAGVAKIQHALESPAIPSREFGEGVEWVAEATRGLGELEEDPRVALADRIDLIVEQARSWASAAEAIEHAALLDQLDEEQRAALVPVLREKAFPADVAASSAFRRAYALACTVDASSAREIALEIERRGERVTGCNP